MSSGLPPFIYWSGEGRACPPSLPHLTSLSYQNFWSDTYIRDAIVEPALGRDLLQLHPVASPALLRQLFGAAVALPAQVVSLHKLQGTLQERGSVPTIQNYLHLLSQAFLISGIQKYSPSLFRSRKSSSKLIVHDNALVRAFERPIGARLSPERLGHYFENAIGARFIEAGWDTYYWKHRQYEVDFVVIGPEDQRYAIEVKTGRTSQEEMKGLLAFCAMYPDFTPCLVSLQNESLDGIQHLGVEDVLSLTRL